ncbi:helix-turn-helix domain-containing protein [Roseovarius aestuarii]|nr:helix-turn-helix domain-containing protein [Roseovarius aestuarii]
MVEVQVTVLVEQGFVPTELAMVQDVLRIANRLGHGIRFDVNLCTTTETDVVEGKGGMFVQADPLPTDDAVLSDYLVVLGGTGIGACFNKLRTRLRWCERMGQSIILMSDAAAAWRGLNPEANWITTHWEDHQVWSSATCDQHDKLPLFTKLGRITTAAGMASAADIILSQIVAPRSSWLSQAVSNIMLMDRIRDDGARQPRSENDVNALRLIKLETAIAAMESNLEEPLAMTDLAAISGVSIRQFERKFKAYLGQTPMAFYRSLRLRRAKTLIEQTALPITEIAVACGFGSSSSFAKVYGIEFGVSPSRRRAQLTTNSVSRIHTSHPKGSHNAPVQIPARTPCPPAHTAGADEASVQRTWRRAVDQAR